MTTKEREAKGPSGDGANTHSIRDKTGRKKKRIFGPRRVMEEKNALKRGPG